MRLWWFMAALNAAILAWWHFSTRRDQSGEGLQLRAFGFFAALIGCGVLDFAALLVLAAINFLHR